MNTYEQQFESEPSAEKLDEIKRLLKSETAGTAWETYYWGAKCIVKYDTEDFEPGLLSRAMNAALKYGLSYRSNKERYLDAIKILASAYFQMAKYDLVMNCLGSVLELESNSPDWVYHDFITAQNRTNYIRNNLRRPQMFLDDLSHNDSGSATTRKKQEKIFKEFLAAGVIYLSKNKGAAVDRDTLAKAAKSYDASDSAEWRAFTDACNGKEVIVSEAAQELAETSGLLTSSTKNRKPEKIVSDGNEKVSSGARPLVISLFPEEEPENTKDDMAKKYDELMLQFTRTQEELQKKNAELEKQARQAQAELTEKNQKLESVSSSLIALQQMNDALQKSVEKHKLDLKDYEGEISAKDKEIADIQAKLSTAQQGSSAKKELEKQIKIAQSQREEMKIQYDAVQATLAASQERLKVAGEQLKNTALENKALKEELERLKKANAKPMKGNKAAQLMGDYSKYIYITTEKLSKWLTRNLKVFREWWEDCVISKLSNEQVMYATDGHFNSLDDFDLAALLRILSKNWKSLKKYNFMPDSAKDNLDQMFEVRNRWAHFNSTPPSKDNMIDDLAVISEFLSFLNCDRETLQEVSKFAVEVGKMEI